MHSDSVPDRIALYLQVEPKVTASHLRTLVVAFQALRGTGITGQSSSCPTLMNKHLVSEPTTWILNHPTHSFLGSRKLMAIIDASIGYRRLFSTCPMRLRERICVTKCVKGSDTRGVPAVSSADVPHELPMWVFFNS